MTTYYYYPSQHYNTSRQAYSRSSAPLFDRMTTSRPHRSISPPGLSRASTPDYSAPATPVISSAFLRSSKAAQQKAQVGFPSQVVTSAYRRPEADELSVMRAFASHASHCDRCCDMEKALRRSLPICRTGTQLGSDIGKYFFCVEGKPYSVVDRDYRKERVQVEVPAEYGAVKTLFECLYKGLSFSSLKQERPKIHQSQAAPTTSQSSNKEESYEIKPSGSSRLHRSNTYTGYRPVHDDENRPYKYETRTPHDDRYRDENTHHKSRREHKRSSRYDSPERRSKRQSYVGPLSSFIR